MTWVGSLPLLYTALTWTGWVSYHSYRHDVGWVGKNYHSYRLDFGWMSELSLLSPRRKLHW